MTRMDRWMPAGAWVVMAIVGPLCFWKTTQTPRVEPWVAAAKLDFNRNPELPRQPRPGPVPRWNGLAYFGPVAEARPMESRAGSIPLKLVGQGMAHPIVEVGILPLPVIGAAKADLDGATITWTLAEYPVELQAWMRRKAAKPSGFVVKRQCEGGASEPIAKLGPEARSFSDLSTEPKRTYRYWVLVTGEETKRSSYPPELEQVTRGLDVSAEARTPSAVRVKLIGGDRSTAFVRIEAYDRAQKKWIAKTVMAAPGKEIGSSGWTLKGLRFDNFTLVADVSDDGGVDRVLTTKD